MSSSLVGRKKWRVVRKWNELPSAAQAYLDRIASLAGVPIRLVSVGPEREQVVEKI